MTPDTFWQALEGIDTQCAVSSVWREWLGTAFEGICGAFLQSLPDRPVRHVPCLRACGCWHEVVFHGPADIVGVCTCEPWNCADLVLTRSDIIPLALSWPKLTSALRGALALGGTSHQVGLYNTRQVGSWSAEALPVVLTIQPSQSSFLVTVSKLVARLRQPFLLLAPTVSRCDPAAREVLAGVGAGFFALESIVRVRENGAILPARAPGELFARFTPEPNEPVEEGVARQAFALVKALDSEAPGRKASVYTVFRLYCIEGLSVQQVARRCRCGRSLVFERLKRLRQKLRRNPAELRHLSSHFEAIEDSLSDPRAAAIHRKRSIYGEEEDEEE